MTSGLEGVPETIYSSLFRDGHPKTFWFGSLQLDENVQTEFSKPENGVTLTKLAQRVEWEESVGNGPKFELFEERPAKALNFLCKSRHKSRKRKIWSLLGLDGLLANMTLETERKKDFHLFQLPDSDVSREMVRCHSVPDAFVSSTSPCERFCEVVI